MTSPVDPSKTVCGDLLCSNYVYYYGYSSRGTCTADGQFKPCGQDGRLGAPYACPNNGIWEQTSSTTYNGYTPGACTTVCQNGDQRCTGTSATSYEICNNASWSAPVECPAGDGSINRCLGYTNPKSRPATVCGVCVPGSHKCTSYSGTVTNDGIQTCGADGQWGAAAACTVGLCAYASGDYECLAQCIPGSTVCTGYAATPTGGGVPSGTTSFVTCSQTGTIPAAPDCVTYPGATGCCAAGTTSCRKSATGASLGCVQCVGSSVVGGNEYGNVDGRCTAANGGVGAAAVETCTATNTWPTGPQDTCPAGTTCQSTVPRYCSGGCGFYYYPDGGISTYHYVSPCTESGIRAATGGAWGCVNYSSNYPPGPCGVTPDCCEYLGSPTSIYGYCYSSGYNPTGAAYCQ
jgi:hypothetical protein